VRHFGLSLVWQAVGGSVGGRADEVLALSSTREAEAAADTGAIGLLHGAGIATAPTAAFFDRQLKAGGGKAEPGVLATLGGYLSSHPDDGQRSALFKAASRPGTPALSQAQWQALRSMCAAPAKADQPSGGRPMRSRS
jgi:beta-barrel assembly-enhancing protease